MQDTEPRQTVPDSPFAADKTLIIPLPMVPTSRTEAREKKEALDAYNRQMEEESKLDNVLREAQARRDLHLQRVKNAEKTNSLIDAGNDRRMARRKRFLGLGFLALLIAGAVKALELTVMAGW